MKTSLAAGVGNWWVRRWEVGKWGEVAAEREDEDEA